MTYPLAYPHLDPHAGGPISQRAWQVGVAKHYSAITVLWDFVTP